MESGGRLVDVICDIYWELLPEKWSSSDLGCIYYLLLEKKPMWDDSPKSCCTIFWFEAVQTMEVCKANNGFLCDDVGILAVDRADKDNYRDQGVATHQHEMTSKQGSISERLLIWRNLSSYLSWPCKYWHKLLWQKLTVSITTKPILKDGDKIIGFSS